MATAPVSPVLRFIRRLRVSGSAAELSDRELLELYVRQRDEAAFAALLRRHGPMVLGVCRRVLRDAHAAEDAFQATFLVLARKAGSLTRPDSVGPWLHGVAARTARKARVDATRRRTQEAKAAIAPTVEASDDLVWHDLRQVLDEAVASLDDKYRLPFVRCYLEGETVADVARQLGCPRGTIAIRLSRARERLRVRLNRLGVTLTTAALLLALSDRAASACVSASLAEFTLRAATAGVSSVEVAALTKGVLQAMSTTKIKTVAALTLVFAFAGGGIRLLSRATPAEPLPASAKEYRIAAQSRPRAKLQQKIYQVTDLVLVSQRGGKIEKPGSSQEAGLIELIVELVAPSSWGEKGGVGTIEYFPLTMSLVVNQTRDAQDQIANLLSVLRRIADSDPEGKLSAILRSTREGRAFLRRYLHDSE